MWFADATEAQLKYNPEFEADVIVLGLSPI
jgi:hypothetical protein